MSGRTIRLVVGLAFMLNFSALGGAQDAPPAADVRTTDAEAANPTAPEATTDPTAAGENGPAAADPVSMDVEFDVGELEGFDSDEFDLAAVDPEADAELRGTVQNVLLATGVIVLGLMGLVIYFRSRRRASGK